MTPLLLIVTLLPLASAYSALLTISNASASISNYYQNFASCSCDLTPGLCDNYCCCDPQCSSASTWVASNLCLITASSIEIPCGQSSRGFGSISDLACVYYSNRGTIGYYYQSQVVSSITYPSSNLFASLATASPSAAQTSLLASMSLATPYTANNQYLMTSTSSYLFVPLPGPGGVCTPGLLNFTSSGTYTCRVTPTAQNCASINVAFVAASSICTNSNCTPSSPSFSIPASSVSGSNCQNILTRFTLSAVLGYSNGAYTLQSPTVSTLTNPSASLNTQYTVTVSVNIAPANNPKSGNPGYLQGKPITMSGGIAAILDSTTGNCATSASGSAISLPFAVSQTLSCPSPSACTNTYYIDSLSSLNLTINKYASQSTDSVSVSASNTLGCNASSYTLNILYSSNGWVLDPQHYIVGASLTTTPTPDASIPTNKYLNIKWTYVDPTTVSAPPSNSFYTYFSYLWTPLKQKFGIS